jgi:hypothetical protein
MRLHIELRDQFMAQLKDEDFGFNLGRANPPPGDLCRRIGEVQTSHIQSFQSLKQDFSYRHSEGVPSVVCGHGLRSWMPTSRTFSIGSAARLGQPGSTVGEGLK